ncbi:Beta-xylosidase [compost metagenome]
MKNSFIHIPYLQGCPVHFRINDYNSEELHQHSGLEIIWLLHGKLKITVKQNDYLLLENDLILINHFEPHQIVPKASDAYFIQLHIDSLFINKYNHDFYSMLYDLKSFKNSEDNQKPYDVIRILFSQLITRKYSHTVEINSDVLRLLGYLTLRFSKSLSLTEPENSFFYKNSNIVQQMLDRVEQDFKGKLTLSEIALEQHYNSSYLSDQFRKIVGVTFKAYLEEIRIRYSLFLLQHQEASISNVALASGFSDEKSYYKAIKNKFSLTPLQLRKKYQVQYDEEIYLINHLNVELINHYAAIPIEPRMIEDNTIQMTIVKDIQTERYELKQAWNKIINIGSANTLLNQNIRDQIKEIHEEIQIEYLRFEGVFNQEMDVVQKEREGFKFNWKFINNILDYLVDIGVKPFICLSYMPPLFASKSTSFFNYQGNTSPPKEMSQWLSLVQSFMMNCMNRYSHNIVSEWYFQIWTEFPVHDIHWSGTLEQYLELYKQTALLIKGISPTLKVGPAAENFHTEEHISEKLLEYCEKNEIPIDFYSCNIYHNRIKFKEWLERSITDPIDIKLIPFQYEEKNHTKNLLEKMHRMLKSNYKKDIEFIVTRWNFSWDVTNFLHDTAFMATFIIDNMLDKSVSLTNAIGYLSASDILYEWDIKNTPFFGGTGLINTEGIKKSAYYAFVFLSKLGSTVFAKGKNYIMTRQGEDIQILVYNHTYPDQLFMRGEKAEKISYDIFEESSDLLLNIHLKNIYGTYKCKQYSMNRHNGSAYDEWIRMGEYVDLNHEETDYLKNISRPSLKLKQLTLQGDLHLALHVPVHGVECILLNKFYN